MHRLITRLVYWQQLPFIGPLVEIWLKARGTYIPADVQIGRDLELKHMAHGVVIHPRTTLGDRVVIFHNVTIGRMRPWELPDEGVVDIADDVFLCTGAVVAVPPTGLLRVGKGTVIGAHSVLTTSTGDGEIWAGAPARLIGYR